MKSQLRIIIALIFLVVQLIFTHSKLLFHLNPDAIIAKTGVFDFTQLGVENIMAEIISLCYSVMSTIIIMDINLASSRKWFYTLLLWFAIIDGTGVWLYYAVLNDFHLWGTIY
jgi:hypothetical protein